MTYWFPKTALISSRVPVANEALEVFEGQLPSDLEGHVFANAAVGDMEHESPSQRSDNTPFLNGDGFVFRVSFPGAKGGDVTLSSRPIETPCHIADRILANDESRKDWRFANYGIARISISYLGGRNFANTALLAIPPKNAGDPHRLLATYDAGRPFEIDPVTLRTVRPIGTNADWKGTLMVDHPFPFTNSSAHPAYDPITRELFTVNFVRDAETLLRRLLQWLPSFGPFDLPVGNPLEMLALLDGLEMEGLGRFGPVDLGRRVELVRRAIDLLHSMIVADRPKRATYVMRVDDAGKVDKWKLVDEDGNPIEILHSSHQVGLTKDYILVVDTGFKFEVDQLWSRLAGGDADLERALRGWLSKPQPRPTPVYIVKRADLRAGVDEVRVVSGSLDGEIVHFFTNYELHDGRIVMHVADQRSSDAAEFVTDSDLQQVDPTRKIPREAIGGLSAPMDLNDFACLQLDPKTGIVRRKTAEHNFDHTFGIGLITAPDFPMWRDGKPVTRGTGEPNGPRPQREIDACVFFYAHGFIPSLLSQLVFDLYSKRPSPIVTPKKMLELAKSGGTAATVCRFDTVRNRVVDFCKMPPGAVIISPQFVPGTEGRDFLICNVFTDTSKEIWIFDAMSLRKPLCKLRRKGHEMLPWPYTLHTCWMPEIRELPVVQFDNEDDFRHVRQDREVYAFLRDEVFPHLYR
ncbi:carotenoid oxygenase family protein [Sandaracinus amylolyticus]|uniref:Lignostilbene-alpha,beta-dioxygenase n=1 Tax=Sandaracinus amylolyticus TaxID=927083 RepID=A0A0F6VZB0_9BACT|nr:carotenoid oxygenase family protein [Sandaracinus amylolyticus]AKF03448.1 hypothetical protein DB32_000597 [Sandaracinus amylolyticus]